MQVILLQDVAKVGRRFEVVEVPNGHALNMLIPKGMAKPATPENLKQIEAQKAKQTSSKEDAVEQFENALALIEDKPIVVSAAANEKGHFFEALKPESIIGAIGGYGAVIKESQLEIDSPIKEAGEYTVVLHEGDVRKEVVVTVEAAEAQPED
ncbi:50S ribosomal protein L9 [Candidatus Pacebacteria bacterium]|nr:50S ribosomal protein L9 [Candidatus Paceibacterota bacterium]